MNELQFFDKTLTIGTARQMHFSKGLVHVSSSAGINHIDAFDSVHDTQPRSKISIHCCA